MININLEKFSERGSKRLKDLESKNEIVFEIDIFRDCLDELFDIDNPKLKPENPEYKIEKNKFIDHWTKKGDFSKQGNWIYYPWSKTLIHFPDEDIYIKLRTSRNRNLITTDEQNKFQSNVVGIAGMSVGSNILNTLVLIGGPRHFKIADYDTISVPNLNRIMATASAVGVNKAVYFARKALEVDPYLKIDIYDKGLNISDFKNFFENPKLDLYIEEMDNPYLKIKSREYAKKLKIPVIMAADNGDGALIDVERFDLQPYRPIFHGNLDKVIDLENIKEELTFKEKLTLIANIVQLHQATTKAQMSLGDVGKTLNTWPQLGTAALTCGVTLSYVARKILLGENMKSGRYQFSLDAGLENEYHHVKNKIKRKLITAVVMKKFKELQKK